MTQSITHRSVDNSYSNHQWTFFKPMQIQIIINQRNNDYLNHQRTLFKSSKFEPMLNHFTGLISYFNYEISTFRLSIYLLILTIYSLNCAPKRAYRMSSLVPSSFYRFDGPVMICKVTLDALATWSAMALQVSKTTMSASTVAMWDPMSPCPYRVVHIDIPPVGQAGLSFGLKNRSLATNLYRGIEVCNRSAWP